MKYYRLVEEWNILYFFSLRSVEYSKLNVPTDKYLKNFSLNKISLQSLVS